ARASAALELVRAMLAMDENVETQSLFVRCVRSLRKVPRDNAICDLMIRALTEPWGRPSDLSGAAISLIRQDATIGSSIERALAAWPRRIPARELFGSSGEAAITSDRLLIALLES